MNVDWAWGLGGFALGVLISSLAEYWVHILMHQRIFLSRTHFKHHREPEGETWFKQFAYYLLGGLIPAGGAIVLGEWGGILPLGIGFAVGVVFWAAWVAYAHTLQHHRPELVFWMRRPVHYLHHRYEMARHNFGLSVDWWDHVFGTYKIMPWEPPAHVRRRVRDLARIPWFYAPVTDNAVGADSVLAKSE